MIDNQDQGESDLQSILITIMITMNRRKDDKEKRALVKIKASNIDKIVMNTGDPLKSLGFLAKGNLIYQSQERCLQELLELYWVLMNSNELKNSVRRI